MDFVLLGMQGSGKGTQGRFLAEKYGYHVFEMGGAFRALLKTDSPLADEIRDIINRGDLVDDARVMRVFYDAMEKLTEKSGGSLPARMIYDGIPRQLGQKDAFDAWVAAQHRDFQVIHIVISQEEAIRRLLKRKVCSVCGKSFMPDYASDVCDVCGGTVVVREDETAPAIKKRIENFLTYTMPVIEAYEQEGKLIAVNGEQSPEAVFQELEGKIAPFI